MDPIIFNGKEVGDIICFTTDVKITFKMRMEILFSRRFKITQECGTDKPVVTTDARIALTTYPFWETIRDKFRKQPNGLKEINTPENF